MTLREQADFIVKRSIEAVMPDEAVRRALDEIEFDSGGKIILIAAGKAGYEMARAAAERLGGRISDGVVITKYGHVKGEIEGVRCFEAGHPIPDENGFSATQKALDAVSGLSAHDNVLFLLSGGGSALFEKPLISGEELEKITKRLLSCGADIVEINTVRKRLSAVKGGKFALACRPAHVYTVVLSDIIGDPLDMMASGPAYPDASDAAAALRIAKKYALELSAEAEALLAQEPPKTLDNVTTFVTGSVKNLCRVAEKVCAELGYETVMLTSSLNCEARDAGAFLGAIARDHQHGDKPLAYLAGGETVVHITGGGLGGRNQETALSAAALIDGCRNTCVFSFGSDGTDGPTDAAGGYADENTKAQLSSLGIDIYTALENNDSYHALEKVNGLIVTGPTGTNVNDLALVLIDRR